MLTENIASELGLANGTIGIFQTLIYETEDSNVDQFRSDDFEDMYEYITKPLVALIHIPNHHLKFEFENLPLGVVPISVRSKNFIVDVSGE